MVERKVASVPIFAYVNDQHPLSQHNELELSDIENLETVRVSMGSLDVSAYYERMRKLTGVNLEQKLTVSSMAAALDCVKSARMYLSGCTLTMMPYQRTFSDCR